MSREIRELLVLVSVGLVLGVGHLALRADLPWVPPPREDAALCGSADPAPPEPPASPAPMSSEDPSQLMTPEAAP